MVAEGSDGEARRWVEDIVMDGKLSTTLTVVSNGSDPSVGSIANGVTVQLAYFDAVHLNVSYLVVSLR